MKKTFILISFTAVLFLGGCKKGLEPQLYGTYSTTNFPITEADFVSYVAEVYKPFQSKFGYNDPAGYQNDWFSPEYGDVMLFDYPTDNSTIFTGYGGFFTQFSTASFTFLINQGTSSNHFEKIRFITRITKIIDDINKSSISGMIKNQANGLAGPVMAKYPDLGGSTVNAFQGNDFPKARLGDVMLQLAEAINQNSGPTSEAIALVNQVRLAHGGASLGNMPASATASKQAFDTWILKEEGWETYFEGQRKTDLIRHGQYQQALATVGKTAGPYLLPVPAYAITASKGKLTQTPGY